MGELDLDIDDLEKELDEAEKTRNTHALERNRSSTMTHHNNKSTVDDQFMESCAIMNSIVVDRQSSSLMVDEETRRVKKSRIK